MRTQGEIEAAVCEGISRFEQEYMGRGPKDIHTHVIGDLLVVRLSTAVWNGSGPLRVWGTYKSTAPSPVVTCRRLNPLRQTPWPSLRHS